MSTCVQREEHLPLLPIREGDPGVFQPAAQVWHLAVGQVPAGDGGALRAVLPAAHHSRGALHRRRSGGGHACGRGQGTVGTRAAQCAGVVAILIQDQGDPATDRTVETCSKV